MSTQIFTTIPEQIELLKSRGLDFRSIEHAADELRRHGYYNIINGYKDNYVSKSDSGEQYRNGIYFEQIFSLFSIDHDIRNGIMIAMLEIEEQLKTQLAYVIAENFSADYNKYSDIKNYRNTHVNNRNFTLAAILQRFDEAYRSGKDPIKYNRETYGNVPPWVLFKGLYFSTIVTFTRYLKGPQKEELLTVMFDVPPNIISDPYFKKLASNIFTMFKEFRNVCAHGGRIYNYIPLNTYTIHEKFKYALELDFDTDITNGIGLLLIALYLLKDKRPYLYLTNILQKRISMHCQRYPDDTEYLVNAMGISDLIEIHDV